MDTRPAHHLSTDQTSAINSVRSLTMTLETVLKGHLKRGSETSQPPAAVRSVFDAIARLRDEATLAVCNHSRP